MISGPMLAAWLTPPIVPLLKIHVFNITNPDQVSIKLKHFKIKTSKQVMER